MIELIIAIGLIALALILGLIAGRTKWFDRLMKDISDLIDRNL